FYFSTISGSVEDRGTPDFLRKMAAHAGIPTRHIDLEDIGLNGEGRFVDLEGQPIQRLFKLHAWEHIFHEAFGKAIPGCDTQFI
ncbi:glutathionylspermidine synthase family protein, partial [Pseudomonas sp. SIMBA_068]|uniref:glutathionylspermidine synthase family protein n=1 Tax=Pseudomonas sp. SIMBA_068 TaxID=3085808 RepID=UPI00397CAB27